eukprot:TRINITY_DN30711_c0_g1_i1.p1 TRINITY_DN30711_c0_g1~~TRINITY_DN30711_c0_g1_i1.p1  ORF type:complete len:299 (+),score=40.81 TRINITY_DN30711_c0_g1_i1:44-898(+)
MQEEKRQRRGIVINEEVMREGLRRMEMCERGVRVVEEEEEQDEILKRAQTVSASLVIMGGIVLLETAKDRVGKLEAIQSSRIKVLLDACHTISEGIGDEEEVCRNKLSSWSKIRRHMIEKAALARVWVQKQIWERRKSQDLLSPTPPSNTSRSVSKTKKKLPKNKPASAYKKPAKFLTGLLRVRGNMLETKTATSVWCSKSQNYISDSLRPRASLAGFSRRLSALQAPIRPTTAKSALRLEPSYLSQPGLSLTPRILVQSKIEITARKIPSQTRPLKPQHTPSD